MTAAFTACLLMLAVVLTAAWFLLLLRERGNRPIRDVVRMVRELPPLGRAVVPALFVVTWLAASTKPGSGTNSPPSAPSVPLPPIVPLPAAATPATNLCFTAIAVDTNGVVWLDAAWPEGLFDSGSILDLFASTTLSARVEWPWLAAHAVSGGETNCTVGCPLVEMFGVRPAAAFFSAALRAEPSDMRDTDGDSLPDLYEWHNGTNPHVSDYALAPKLSVGPNGDYSTIAAALSASADYSIVEVEQGDYSGDGWSWVQMPPYPVMVVGVGGGATITTSDLAAFLLPSNCDSRTVFRNLRIRLAGAGLQAGFWCGGNLPWSGSPAAATFEDVHVRILPSVVEGYGWLF